MSDFIRPLPSRCSITRLFGEAGKHFIDHIDEKSGTWVHGQICASCRQRSPCHCLGPDPSGQHSGIDFACQEGTTIAAVVDGMVVRRGPGRNASPHANGLVIVQLVSAMGYDSWHLTYRNVHDFCVKEGDHIRAGDRIGYSGLSEPGSPYLHIELQDLHMQYRPIPLPPCACDICDKK